MKALITGASSGIGYDIAIQLSVRGYDIIAVARNEERLQKLKNEAAGDVQIISMDLDKKKNCYKLYEKCRDQDIDVLVNGAGFGLFGPFKDTDIETEISMIKTNITAVHILTKLFYRNMAAKNKGTIMNVASIAGFLPGPLMSTYYASKAYVVRLTQALNEENKLNRSNVKICLLCPGPVDTRFSERAGLQLGLKGLSSEYVAEYAIKKMLKGSFMIVPGGGVKATRVFAKLFPDSLTAKGALLMQHKKIK